MEYATGGRVSAQARINQLGFARDRFFFSRPRFFPTIFAKPLVIYRARLEHITRETVFPLDGTRLPLPPPVLEG